MFNNIYLLLNIFKKIISIYKKLNFNNFLSYLLDLNILEIVSECANVIAPKKANNKGNKIASSFNHINNISIELIEISQIRKEDLTYLIKVLKDTSPYKKDCCSKIEGILCQKIK